MIPIPHSEITRMATPRLGTARGSICLRSWLFVPATRPERFAKAARSGADALIIDLEDAVAPQDKRAARDTVIGQWPSREHGPKIALRVNPIDTRFGFEDLTALFASAIDPDFILLPKSNSAEHLRLLDRLLADAGKQARLIALVETAPGLAAADAIAQATPRLAAAMLGAADLASDLGATTAWEPMLYARGRMIAACALGGILPIDAPFFAIGDETGLAEEARRATAMGFAAKAAIHPTQIEPINAAFTPDEAAVVEARTILVEAAKGCGVVNGKMVDEAMARRARRILAMAGLPG